MDLNVPLAGDTHVFIDGSLVSNRVSNIVEAIRDYSPELQVRWIPPAERSEGQAAYQIVHHPPGMEPYCMLTVRRDEDFTEEVLTKIIQGDQRNGKTSMSQWEASIEAAKHVKRQEWLDKLDELGDIAAHVLKSPLNKYSVKEDILGRDLVIRDYGNRIR